MADDKLRARRTRDPIADFDPLASDSASDPLAELARLIGQSDPVGEHLRTTSRVAADTLADVRPGADAGWAADDDYDQPLRYPESRQAPAQFGEPYPDDRAYPEHSRDYEDEPPGEDRYAGPASNYGEAANRPMADETYYRDDEESHDTDRSLPTLAPRSDVASYENDEPWQDTADDQSYVTEDYDEQGLNRSRRSGIVIVAAVLGLVTLGVAGAFGYRMLVGGKLFPTLPPIIKAIEGPNKIVPSQSNSQAEGPNQTNGTSGGTGEKLVSREEQPLNIQTPPNSAPRVISTIPIAPAPSAGSQGSPQPTSTTPAAPADAAPPAAPSTSAAPATSPAPPPPAPAGSPPPSSPSQNSMPPAAAAASTAPKKVHTVVIRTDQSGAMNVANTTLEPPASPPPSPASNLTPRTQGATAPRPRNPPSTASTGPMDILHQSGGEQSSAPLSSPPPASTTVARAEPAAGPLTLEPGSSSPVPAGGYAIQLTSQRSEEEARAAYRELQAKFPGELGGRSAIIRRADLGAKGTYYRAMIGPFTSVEEAAGICSKLKAAGGSCLVQRN